MKLVLIPFALQVLCAACIPVESDRITARDLAQAVPAFQSVAPDVAVALAPLPGIRRVIGFAELERSAARHGVHVTSPQEVCVEYPTTPLTAERVTTTLKASLGDPAASVEILELSRYPVPAGELEFPLKGMNRTASSSPESPVVWRGVVRYASNRVFPVWAKVRVSIQAEQIVATENIAAGQSLSKANMQVVTTKALPSSEKGVPNVDEWSGRVVRRNITAGQRITTDALGPQRDVKRGDVVQVSLRGTAAKVSFSAEAESSGSAGQSIAVLNPISKKQFHAVIDGTGRVHVDVMPLRRD